MPTFRDWTATIVSKRTPLVETDPTIEGNTVTCQVPCRPNNTFEISLSNPTNGQRYVVVYLLDGIQHDEAFVLPGNAHDKSIGWHHTFQHVYRYKWVKPKHLNVRCDGTQRADSHQVGIIGVRLYVAPADYHIQEVLLRNPIKTRGFLVRKLTSYAGTSKYPSSRKHPTREVLGCWRPFEWLEAGEPFLEFNFQYFGNVLADTDFSSKVPVGGTKREVPRQPFDDFTIGSPVTGPLTERRITRTVWTTRLDPDQKLHIQTDEEEIKPPIDNVLNNSLLANGSEIVATPRTAEPHPTPHPPAVPTRDSSELARPPSFQSLAMDVQPADDVSPSMPDNESVVSSQQPGPVAPRLDTGMLITPESRLIDVNDEIHKLTQELDRIRQMEVAPQTAGQEERLDKWRHDNMRTISLLLVCISHGKNKEKENLEKVIGSPVDNL